MIKKALNPAVIGIAITLFLALIAELFRFKGILLIDLWVPVFTVSLISWKFYKKELIALPRTVYPAAFFVAIGFASLLIHSGNMSFAEFAKSTFFGVRWTSMFLLSVILANEKKSHNTILWMIFIFATLLAIAGFIQLKFVPDFTDNFTQLGWDPHRSRLLSTWFDPNFVGGFFGFTLALIIGVSFDKKPWRPYLAVLGVIVLIALGLTLSRSGYLTFIVAVIVIGLLRSWKMLAIMAVAAVLLTGVSGRIQDRVFSIFDSTQSVFTETYTIPDPSSRLRFASWETGWELFLDSPIIGQGYNRFSHAALESGQLKDLNLHQASGSDSSLLTILATTGLAGFLPFITIYIFLAQATWKRRDGFSSGFLGGLAGLFVHSVFVNSLLFPLLMAPFWICAGMLKIAPGK